MSFLVHIMSLVNGFSERPMNSEKNRLFTFKKWPSSAPINAERLARAGFYYNGNGLEVSCFSCNGKITNWFYGDQAFEKHRRIFPTCQFVLGKSNNEPFISSLGRSSFNRPNVIKSERRPNSVNSERRPNSVNTSKTIPSPICRNSIVNFETRITPSCNHIEKISNITDSDTEPCVCSHDENYFSRQLIKEAERLDTFSNWTVHYINKRQLAAAGFFYFGYEDKVQCAFCGGILGLWEPNDIPIEEHRKHFPHCQFVCGMDVGNIPIQEQSINQRGGQTSLEPRLRDETGNLPFEHLGIISNIPKHPQLSTLERRLATFSNWPQEYHQTPQQLAEAGFVYAGFSDNVKCFFCDVGLRNWDPKDDPWVEHARWFGNCGFLRLNKGVQFIEQVRRAYPQDNQYSLPPSSPHHVPPIMTSRRISEEHPRRVGHQNERAEMETVSQIEREMQSQPAQAALSFGFNSTEIHQAISEKLRLTGCGFSHTENLVTAIIDNRRNDSSAQYEGATSSLIQLPEIEKPPISQIPITLNLTPKFGDQQTSPTSPLSIEEEYQMLKDQRMCKICMDHEVAVVFLPCGHLICCTQCAPALRECPICRQIIRGSVRTFLS